MTCFDVNRSVVLYDKESGQVDIVDFGLSEDVTVLDIKQREEEKEKERRALLNLKKIYLYPGETISSTTSTVGEESGNSFETEDMFEFGGSFKNLNLLSTPQKDLNRIVTSFDLAGLDEGDNQQTWSGPLIKSFSP